MGGIRFTEQRAAGAHLRSAEMKLPNIGQKKFKAIEIMLNRFESPELSAESIVSSSTCSCQYFQTRARRRSPMAT